MNWWTLLLFFQAPPTMELPNVTANPHTTPADLAQGRKLFAGRCAGCHGPGGNGGKGADLAVPVLPRASDDRSLYRVVRYGIPETEMPGTLLAPREVWQIAAFVRSLGTGSSGGSVRGDAAAGKRVFTGKGGCAGCHAVGLEGGAFGPPLTGVGAKRGAAHLRNKIRDAASDIPDTFRVAEAKGRDGRTVSGIRLNEDLYSIQIRDQAGRIHSLWKKDLASWRAERKTPMPSYAGKLTDTEIDDVTAYLAGLRGDQ